MDNSRKKIEKQILGVEKFYDWNDENRYTWGEIKKQLEENSITLEDSDVLEISTDNDYHSLSVFRFHEETDEEYDSRMRYESKELERQKERRYEQYLKLKEQFEPEKECGPNCTCK